MAVFLNSNNSQIQSTEEQAKGFLWKIKNGEGRTFGYLCGTIHGIPSGYPPLHDNIYKSLSKSQTLYEEIILLDKQTAVEYLRKDGYSKISEQDLQEVIEGTIEVIRENPTDVEDRLTLKAIDLGIEIKSLETESSREAAAEAIQSKKDHLESTKKIVVANGILVAIQYLHAATKKIDCSDYSAAVKHLFAGYRALIQAFMDDDEIEHRERISGLISKYEQQFTALDLDPAYIKTLKTLYLAHLNRKVDRLAKIQLAWKLGDEKMLVDSLSCLTSMESALEQLRLKELHLRDLFMVDRIHDSLLKSSDKNRSFYAVGCAHLLLDYDNVKKMLENKGWNIVNASSKNESKAMHSKVQ